MADLDRGGLAGAVGTKQAEALLLVDGQGQTSYCHFGAIAILALVHLHQQQQVVPCLCVFMLNCLCISGAFEF